MLLEVGGGQFIILHLVSERTIYKAFLLVSVVGGGSIKYATWCQRWVEGLLNMSLEVRGGKRVYKICHLVSEVGGDL